MAGIDFDSVKGFHLTEETTKTPFEELRDFAKGFERRAINNNLRNQFEAWIDNFKHNLKHRYYLSEGEFGHLHINCGLGEHSHIDAGNLFTACLLFDKYIPYCYIKDNPFEYRFPDGDRVMFQNGEYFLLKADPTKIKTAEELSKMTRAERNKYYKEDKITPNIDLRDAFGEFIESPEDVQHYKEQFSAFRDCLGRFKANKEERLNVAINEFEKVKERLESLSDEELKRFREGLDDVNYKFVVGETDRREKIKRQKEVDEFEKKNPGVPFGAIEIVAGKNYSGCSDGNYEIKTINGKLWFIPGACCDFGEEI